MKVIANVPQALAERLSLVEAAEACDLLFRRRLAGPHPVRPPAALALERGGKLGPLQRRD